MKLEVEKTIDSQYIQQHLANERTFLAWIRTAITVIGIGFLVTNFHYYRSENLSGAEHQLISAIGMLSILFGISTILVGTRSYLKKVHTINTQQFKSAKMSLIALAIGMVFIFSLILFVSYFLL
ncbi:DUF202 domain-containing protein [Exiguobacterium sp. MMG028]|uniref:YidH family protein n=1 Tax=Exiguobacterium sp. MMG028 TaxID=3021979 RepID=UPI0022FE2426|nr:DUF202 domain-containing protein [Exiguobacterium sp. MMG028]MDA5561014.1 DUF202 domain-containing protein [Exiguobacterium sp. MMG028]